MSQVGPKRWTWHELDEVSWTDKAVLECRMHVLVNAWQFGVVQSELVRLGWDIVWGPMSYLGIDDCAQNEGQDIPPGWTMPNARHEEAA